MLDPKQLAVPKTLDKLCSFKMSKSVEAAFSNKVSVRQR